MRVNYENRVQHQGNLTGTDVRMTLDENSLAHLMSVLTDLYSDPALAVIREYSTNALDSHIAAGVKRPIEVSLPGSFAPLFRVKDYGVGLSVEDITNIYSKYGYSTKRDNDDEAGMLGLGCKSGLTYTDAFTVVGVKDGVRATAQVMRGGDGCGSIRIVDTRATDEPNGVEVQVPVSDVEVFVAKAEQFFRWWEPGTVLVDGKQPEAPKGVNIGDDILITQGLDADYVVMGNIAYKVDRYQGNISADLPWRYNVVAWVPMGSVNFTPSREALHYTTRTKDTIKALRVRVKENLRVTAQNAVRDAKSAADAFDAVRDWEGLYSGRYEWGGTDIPTYFSLNGWAYSPHKTRDQAPAVHKAYRSSMHDPRYDADNSMENKCVIVTGYTNTTFTTNNRRRLDAYCEQHDIKSRLFYVVDADFGRPWTDNITRISWDDVKAIKIGGKRSTFSGKVDVWKGSTFESMDPNDIDGDNIIYYSSSQRDERSTNTLSPGRIKEQFPDATVVQLNKNRWDKFQREVGGRCIQTAVNEAADAFSKTLSDDEYLGLSHYRGSDESTIVNLDESKIDDPDFVNLIVRMRAVRAARAGKEKAWGNLVALSRSIYEGCPVALTKRDVTPLDTNLLSRYPYVRLNPYGINDAHKYEYINALYAARKESK